MFDNGKANRMSFEKSLYLRSHSDSPVDWYPWGDEAIGKAKQENKLVFLSIGYASCHSCHVMNRDAFSNESIAKILNDKFISILVDKEEYYDVDNIYMSTTFLAKVESGWPLNIILTPDMKPFYTNTDMASFPTGDMAGFIDVIKKCSNLWEKESDKIIEASNIRYEMLLNYLSPPTGKAFHEDLSSRAIELLFKNWDDENGGIIGKNKFPSVHNLFFLMNHGGEKPLEYVKKQVDSMIKGGIYDRLEGGFHRYTSDMKWRIPHFDKHLYDQASMLGLTTELYLYTDDIKYKKVANQLISFIRSNFMNDENLFFTSIDSDVNSSEGSYYIWEYEQVKKALSVIELEYAKRVFNLSRNGNYHENKNKNILYIDKDPSKVFQDMKEGYSLENYESYEDLYDSIIYKLRESRKERDHGQLDDKILLDLNSYMGAAMMYYGRIFDNNEVYKTCLLLHDNLKDKFTKDDYIVHSYRAHKKPIYGTLIDYSYYILFLINMYQYKGELKFIDEASSLMEIVIRNFWDEDDFGFFETDKRFPNNTIRYKDIYNTSGVPSNAVIMNVLVKLYEIKNDKEYYDYVEKMWASFSNCVAKNPLATISLISSYSKL